jgi:sigma-B regulation protein RsbU (phosphoserine phosphatase)
MAEDVAVLIIDDDEAVRGAFRHVLQQAGLTVLDAEDGDSGLLLCAERAPGVVFVDLRMPKMDGLAVLDAMKERHPDTPVVVISGQGNMNDAIEALRRGAWDFVSKPVENELLVRAARRAVERSSLLRQNCEYSERLRLTNEKLSVALEELRSDEQAARQLQFHLLPEDGLRMGRLSCFRLLYPSQFLSGDFLDYFPLGSRFVGLYLADVAGHGAASAFVTAMLTTLIGKYRDALRSRDDEIILHPLQLLDSLDEDLRSLSVPKHVTLFYAVIDLQTGKLVYGNAGAFPFPFLKRGNDVVEIESAGRPLNLPGRGHFGTGEAQLSAGDRLLLISDGILDLKAKHTYRSQRDTIIKLLGQAAGIQEIAVSLGLADNAPLSDDVALLFAHWEEDHA